MDDTKRQILPSGLWIVATPIGNLSDLTPRARWALEQADMIFCEDTRRTGHLFSALGISTRNEDQSKLQRLDEHTPPRKIQDWAEELKQGKNCALVTDAGTPAISDPGSRLVRAAQLEGVRVTPFPGASAPITLLSASGFHETSFTFRGFFPRKASEQETELEQLGRAEFSQLCVWFESPNRILDSLHKIRELFPNAEMTAGKELTKIHERIFYGTATELCGEVGREIEAEGAVGEWCFAIRFESRKAETSSGPWKLALQCLLEAGISSSEAAKRVSQHFGTPKNEAYEAALLISGKKNTPGGLTHFGTTVELKLWLWKESMEGFRRQILVLVGLSDVRMTVHWGVFMEASEIPLKI